MLALRAELVQVTSELVLLTAALTPATQTAPSTLEAQLDRARRLLAHARDEVAELVGALAGDGCLRRDAFEIDEESPRRRLR
jgi:hypothetical protein